MRGKQESKGELAGGESEKENKNKSGTTPAMLFQRLLRHGFSHSGIAYERESTTLLPEVSAVNNSRITKGNPTVLL